MVPIKVMTFKMDMDIEQSLPMGDGDLPRYPNYWGMDGRLSLVDNPSLCGLVSSKTFICTRNPGHSGPHVAHNSPGFPQICQIWIVIPEEMQVDEGL